MSVKQIYLKDIKAKKIVWTVTQTAAKNDVVIKCDKSFDGDKFQKVVDEHDFYPVFYGTTELDDEGNVLEYATNLKLANRGEDDYMDGLYENILYIKGKDLYIGERMVRRTQKHNN